MRVALYARVSTQDQSTEMQEKELLAYVEARGWALHRLYVDKATGTTDARPALKELMTDARARRFDVVVVWKLDRWGRSLKNLVTSLQELEDAGIRFVSLRDSIDLGSATGRLMVQLLGAMAEFEAALIRERVRAGVQNAKAKGTRFGRPEVGNVEEILRLRTAGKSHRQIGKLLGISSATVCRVLQKSSLEASSAEPRVSGLRDE